MTRYARNFEILGEWPPWPFPGCGNGNNVNRYCRFVAFVMLSYPFVALID